MCRRCGNYGHNSRTCEEPEEVARAYHHIRTRRRDRKRHRADAGAGASAVGGGARAGAATVAAAGDANANAEHVAGVAPMPPVVGAPASVQGVVAPTGAAGAPQSRGPRACKNCGELGHYAKTCKNPPRVEAPGVDGAV